MRGFPKSINTKQDIDNLLAMPEYKEQAEKYLARITKERYIWQEKEVLKDSKDGVTSDTAKVIETVADDGKTVQYVQMELVEDVNAKFFRLGYKAEDAAAIEQKKEK